MYLTNLLQPGVHNVLLRMAYLMNELHTPVLQQVEHLTARTRKMLQDCH